MTSFVVPAARTDVAMVSGLFALFTVLTADVAYIAYNRVSHMLDLQRRQKLVPGGGETTTKEAVIDRCTKDWGLSKAESEVALLAAKGFSNGEIAEMRGSSVPTVKTQLGHIYQKSDLGSRYQLMALVTEEVCEMATDHRAPVAAPTPEHDNVTPLVKKAQAKPQSRQPGLTRGAVAR